jgi:hypothetical protein
MFSQHQHRHQPLEQQQLQHPRQCTGEFACMLMLFILTPNVIAGQRQPQRLCAHVPTPLLNIPVALIARHSSSLEHKHFLQHQCHVPASAAAVVFQLVGSSFSSYLKFTYLVLSFPDLLVSPCIPPVNDSPISLRTCTLTNTQYIPYHFVNCHRVAPRVIVLSVHAPSPPFLSFCDAYG